MSALLWFRRDLRLLDHRALLAAAEVGPVIPVFIRDESVDGLGAAAKWRLGESLGQLEAALEAKGSRLILRSGPAGEVLNRLLAETGASALHWHRLYDPAARARDTQIKTALKESGIAAVSHAGHLLHEPWEVETGQGGAYRVFTPFWKAIRPRGQGAPLRAPAQIATPGTWPESERLEEWHLGAAMRRGAGIVTRHTQAGEAAAQARLAAFLDEAIARYRERRDRVGEAGTSGLSDALSLGEISPRSVWAAARWRMEEGDQGAEAFLRQLAWRDFAHHLMYHMPHLLSGNWRKEWDGFGWAGDPDHPHVIAWKQGRTGVDLVDAAMREMYVTGRMHNRARMVAASYLTKNLLVHWRIGADWFAECLTDWDPACNAMGWQWVAGSGPDAAPYFRVFNPDTQAAKFDSDGTYRRAWIAEGQADPPATARAFFDAVPRRWQLDPKAPRPAPVVAQDRGRKRALAAYERWKASE